MLAFHLKLRTEENLGGGGIGFFRFGLHKLADHVQIQLSNQVSHEHKAVFHHADNMQRFTVKISGDLAGHLLYALLDLLSCQKNSWIFGLNAGHWPASVVIVISSIKTASPELLAKSLETG